MLRFWHATLFIILIISTITLHPRLSLAVFPQLLPHQTFQALKRSLQQSQSIDLDQLTQLKITFSPGYHTFNQQYLTFFSKLELIYFPKEHDWVIRYDSPRLTQTVSRVSTSYVFPHRDSQKECEYYSSRQRFCLHENGNQISIASLLNNLEFNRYFSLFSTSRIDTDWDDSYWLVETHIIR